MPHLVVTPLVCLIDEPMKIQITGLGPGQLVTLQASLTDEKGIRFSSQAFYRADYIGELDLDKAFASGGDFSGVLPMGLLWFLKPEKPYLQLVKRDVMGSPFRITLDLYNAIQIGPPEGGQPLASQTIERWFVSPGVQRIPIKEGRVRGALFIPPGNGTFPGVINLTGGTGGLVEYRASLLASRGFVTLALAYIAYDDLPRTAQKLDLEYFEEAAELLLANAKVRGPGIGVVGSSKGAELGMAMAVFLNQVSALVSINGNTALYGTQLQYRGHSMCSAPFWDERCLITTKGAIDSRGVYGAHHEVAHAGAILPLEKAQCHILFLVGEDDGSANTAEFAAEALARMRSHSKHNAELLSYPGAGHLIEPPGLPLCKESRVGQYFNLWGGEAVAHGKAQEHAWQKIQSFLKKHVGQPGTSKL